ncbi:MAG: DNA polymerase III subunit chi [Acidihalobacter sp.]|jgi:DNA polymerase III subunit chi|uniref:DNA polymerase III subunit chi n=1 Tax=Acidihalobacter sp. TaxID=1872108 RepID=UPI00307CED3E
MTRVDFYLLPSTDETARLRVVCRLAVKIFGLGQQLHIHTADAQQAQKLDRLLWTFQDTSFLPHSLVGSESATPITIGYDNAPATDGDVLINLAPDTPHFFSRFERVAEVVDEQPDVRVAGRTRYRFYRDRGYALQHHQLGS